MHFGETSVLSSVVYLLVGLSAVYQAVWWKAIQRRWSGEAGHRREPLKVNERAAASSPRGTPARRY